MANELVSMQVLPTTPLAQGVEVGTNLVIPPTGLNERLRHFPEDVYDLSPESHLSRFVKVLIGDAGAGQVRKRLFLTRLQSTLQGSHFFDLDRFYGPLFGLRRSLEEILDFDPRAGTGTTAEWDETIARDASFRSRIEQFAKALAYGPTPTGMELIAEALLSVDCDVFESFIQADSSFQTIAELEAQYGEGSAGSIDDMEGVPLSTLEGEQLARLSGDDRRIFTVRPKRRITQREAYDLRRVINKVKPADARLVIDYAGVPLHEPVVIDSFTADSEHWEIISEVSSEPSLTNPYTNQSVEPVEQPRPPFSGYQGEAWSYNADMIGISAYRENFLSTDNALLPVQRVTYADGSTRDFPPDQAVLPRRSVQSGRVVSDGILVVHPYSGLADVGYRPLYEDSYLLTPKNLATSIYSDGVPVEVLTDLLDRKVGIDPFQQNPEHRYWVSPERYLHDSTEEILEIRFADNRLVNYVTMEVSHFPHEMVVEAYTDDAEWFEIYRHTITDSVPKIVPESTDPTQRQGHPQHLGGNHWFRVGSRSEKKLASRVRIRINRSVSNSVPPQTKSRTDDGTRALNEIPYTLAVRSFDVGYRVSSREDFSDSEDGVISSTRDIAGSLVQFRSHELLAENLLTEEGFWRSEPQPVNYAVVNLYVDTRGPGNGDGRVIDRFFLDPTHPGPHITLYYSNDPQVTDGTDAFYEERSWTPIPRDYILQRGWIHLPSTRARYWKFEFTNLSIESYETFIPITRNVRLFPGALVEAMNRNYQRTSNEVPIETLTTLDIVRESRYSDALNVLGVTGTRGLRTAEYTATEALYFPDVNRQQRLKEGNWVFGFTPWQQGDHAPRFSAKGRHVYETAEVVHNTKAAFFVGLRSLQAYRTSWEADDDTQVYYDTFDDFRNLEPGFTWTFEPGYMRTGTVPGTTQVTSRSFPSLHDVSAVQFATVQSPPTQLVPDHNFRDPVFSSYGWDDPDRHLSVGDSQLIYSTTDHSVLNIRHVVPLPKAVNMTRGIVQPDVHPVFTFRDFEALDEDSAAATEGGLATPLAGLSPEGRAYAAVRFTSLTTLTSPLYLQLVNDASGDVLVEKAISAQKGQTVEDYVAFDISAPELVVRARLVQRGKSDDAWKVSSLAIFDDGIFWEFSVNGGSDWQPAQGIRNNDNGVLTFPEPGNQLCYRARATRPNQWISAIKIRPWYVGTKNTRTTGNHRGPNVSIYDADVPIHEDPMFTSWRKPIPPWWFRASQSFPLLPVEGIPNVTEFARFYGRPLSEESVEATDSASARVLHIRRVEERMDFFNPMSDAATRKFMGLRSGIEVMPSLSEAAIGLPVYGISQPVHNTIVRPVFSRRRY